MRKKEIKKIVDRMRMFFMSGSFDSASRKLVEKWAYEIEACLREKK
jgi:hypothetical protein